MALASGVLLVPSRPLFLGAVAIPRCGSVGRPRPVVAGGVPPAAPAPLVGGLRLARCSSRARALQAASRPLRSRVRRAVRLLAPSPPRAGCGCAAGRPRLPPLGLALVGRGGLRCPPCRPLSLRSCGLRRSSSLGGALPRGLAPAPFSASVPPPRKGFLSPLRRRRGKAAAAAYLRRLRVCAASLRSSVYSEKLSEQETTALLLILTG